MTDDTINYGDTTCPSCGGEKSQHESKCTHCRPRVTVIELWPAYFDCGGCQHQVAKAESWPYYEDFLHPDKPLSWPREHGYMPVCAGCADRLRDRFAHMDRGLLTANLGLRHLP